MQASAFLLHSASSSHLSPSGHKRLQPMLHLRIHVSVSALASRNSALTKGSHSEAIPVHRCAASPHPSAPASAPSPALAPCQPTARDFGTPHFANQLLLRSHVFRISSSHSSRVSRGPARASASGRSNERSWTPNPMELVRREAGLQSNRLDPGLRERVEAAVERLGGRVTVGDVAGRAGVNLADADEALKALAYDTQASLKVSAEGEVVYGFDPDFRNRLRSRSLLIAVAPQLRRLGAVLSYLTRVAFGTALIASVALVWLAIAVLLSSRNDDRDRRHGGGGGGGGVTFFMDPADLFLYWDPYYERRRTAHSVEARGEPESMNFVEAVFSFVFGDGDPNERHDERRWQELGAMIRQKGGVVTAEEMAPFLEPPQPAELPPPYSREPFVPYPDESFVLPALIKFGGEPEVDERGRILYRFPALQKTGVLEQEQRRPRFRRGARHDSWNVPLERPWELTGASPGQITGVVTLGLFNLVGVGVLSGLMADPRGPALLAMQGLAFVAGLMLPLKLYAATFFALPICRWFVNQRRNRDIEARNEAREAAVDLINQVEAASGSASPLSAVADKLAMARGAASAALPGGRRGPMLVRDEEIVFDSGRKADGQLNELDAEQWERRLAQREREGEERRGGWRRW